MFIRGQHPMATLVGMLHAGELCVRCKQEDVRSGARFVTAPVGSNLETQVTEIIGATGLDLPKHYRDGERWQQTGQEEAELRNE